MRPLQYLSWDDKARLALGVARGGMCYLHSRPYEAIVHGDLKPCNVLITDGGEPVISDFGLARVTTVTVTRTTPACTARSAYYAPPEVLANPTLNRTTAQGEY